MSGLAQDVPSLSGVQVPYLHGILVEVLLTLIHPPYPTSTPIDELRTRVDEILAVFDDPRYASLDIPDWVHRATTSMSGKRYFSVRNLIRALRDTATELDLPAGERYVLTTVCTCVDNVKSASAGGAEMDMGLSENLGEEVACAVQYLASAWVAFLLWPFYAQMQNHPNADQDLASPCTGLAFARKAMAVGKINQDYGEPFPSVPYHQASASERRLQVRGDRVLGRHKRLPREFFQQGHPARVDCGRIFKHPLVVYKDVYDNDKPKRDSTLLSLELLHRYTQLSSKYTRDPMGSGVMDDPENNISLSLVAHTKFDIFGFVLTPTQTPHTYQVKDLFPRYRGPETLPNTVTFRDHSDRLAGAGGGESTYPVPLPSRELLRTHAVLGGALYASGLPILFDRLLESTGVEWRDVGDLPVPAPDGLSFWKDVVDPGSSPETIDRWVESFADMHIA